MSSNLKPIKVYGKGGPNPPKVAFIVGELGLPHEIVDIQIADVKGPEFTAINPNGRMPAIYDPNTDLTLWESGAIILYLIERYDKEHKLSFPPGSNESYHAMQWLFFQTTGQGPYYGQAVWFMRFHPESVPSAVERYTKEINRVCGVLEGHLQKQKAGTNDDGPWLVGGKMSYADVAFVPWQSFASRLPAEQYNPDDYPLLKAWIEKMSNRKVVKSVLESSAH